MSIRIVHVCELTASSMRLAHSMSFWHGAYKGLSIIVSPSYEILAEFCMQGEQFFSQTPCLYLA
ncbi:MAG: hypothetical protein DMG97_06440 [Acidobacteria bacterium]|nr:MAG: hypothetical protein DMG98_21775 [Acidobacteriota bacterium]PYV75451.1 MAG: hypothetical protein DMG97_06440 [Acidobacteriota bacterium]